MSDDYERALDRAYDDMQNDEGDGFPEVPEVYGSANESDSETLYANEVLQTSNPTSEVIDAKRRSMFEQEFAIAERWASKPNLSNAERCHGVVWEMHRVRDDRDQNEYDRQTEAFESLQDANPDLPASNAPVEPNYRAPEYATFFDEKKDGDIRAFLIKSSKELFD